MNEPYEPCGRLRFARSLRDSPNYLETVLHMLDLLYECEDELDNYWDAETDYNGRPYSNRAMSLAGEVRELIDDVERVK